MKKIAIAAASVLMVSMLFCSCKSHERCPAYGKSNTSNTAVKNS